MRYQIIIRKKNKIVERHSRNKYDEAMMLLETLEETLPDSYQIEFRDTKPFEGQKFLTKYELTYWKQ